MSDSVAIGIDIRDLEPSVAYIDDHKLRSVALTTKTMGALVFVDPEQNISALGVGFPHFFSRLTDNLNLGDGIREHSPVTLLAQSFATVTTAAQRASLKPISTTIIAVPSGMGEEQRAAIRTSAAIAGLKDVELLDAPMAAAFAHLNPEEQPRNFLVVHLGYGHCDYALVRVARNRARRVDSGRVTRISGELLDAKVMEAIILFLRQEGIFLGLTGFKVQDWMNFREVASQARQSLSQAPEAVIDMKGRFSNVSGSLELRSEAAGLAHLLAPVIMDALGEIAGMLEKNQIDLAELDAVIAAGSSATLYPFPDLLDRAYPGKVLVTDTWAVAAGAVCYAHTNENANADKQRLSPRIVSSAFMTPFVAKIALPATLDGGDAKKPSLISGLSDTRGNDRRTDDANAVEWIVAADLGGAEPMSRTQPLDLKQSQATGGVDDVRTLIRSGKLAEASAMLAVLLDEVHSLNSELKTAVSSPGRRYLNEAQQMMAQGLPEQAVALSHKAYSLAPDDPEIVDAMMLIHAEAGRMLLDPCDYEAAVQILLCAHGHDPTDRRIHMALAQRHYLHALHLEREDRYPEAMDIVLRALTYNPTHAQAEALMQRLSQKSIVSSQ